MICSSVLRILTQRVLLETFKYGWRKGEYLFHPSLLTSCQYSSSSERSTVFALSTPPGISAVAVVRISGPNASAVLKNCAKKYKLPEARNCTLCRLRDPETDEFLDKALVIWFPAPNSFTGEDICELHIHGGNAVIKSVMKALQKLPNFRFAEPGEFTKRAFMSGKLDLTEVEGLADLLHAETVAQHRQALRQMDGALHKLYMRWSERIKKCLVKIEAYIDFSEDQHLDEGVFVSIQGELDVLRQEISSHLQDKRKGEKLRSGVHTVIVGKPNVGKSSLLNCLCRRDVAIVSPGAGTTRDPLETSLDLGGHLVHLCDTAGIRDSRDDVEREGVRRARDRASKADLLILVADAGDVLELLDSSHPLPVGMDLARFLLSRDVGESIPGVGGDGPGLILLLNKADLLGGERRRLRELEGPSVRAVSCADGTGVAEFVEVFAAVVRNMCSGPDSPGLSQARHRLHVESCARSLAAFEASWGADAALAAEELRAAAAALGRITGRVRQEDVLDAIFRDFCIGK